jgi:hypothetical protein
MPGGICIPNTKSVYWKLMSNRHEIEFHDMGPNVDAVSQIPKGCDR